MEHGGLQILARTNIRCIAKHSGEALAISFIQNLLEWRACQVELIKPKPADMSICRDYHIQNPALRRLADADLTRLIERNGEDWVLEMVQSMIDLTPLRKRV